MTTDNIDTDTTTSKRGRITMPAAPAAPKVKRPRKSPKSRLVIDDAATMLSVDQLVASRTVQYGFAPTRAQVIHALVQQALAAIPVGDDKLF